MPSPAPHSRSWLTVLIAGAFAVATLAAGCGDSGSGSADSGKEATPTAAPVESTPTEEATEGEAAGQANAAEAALVTQGAAIFKDSNCSSCHQLAAADAKGRIGPNLDEVKPSAAVVEQNVIEGPGSMPSFKGQLSDEQIDAVAAYVAQVAGG